MAGTALRRIRARGPLAAMPVEVAAAGWRFAGREARRLLVRHLYGVRMGEGCQVGRGLRLVFPQRVELGRRVIVGDRVRFSSDLPSGRLVIGDDCDIARGCLLDFSGGLSLGQAVLISEGALIYTHDHGRDPRSQPAAVPLSIGAGAWIGVRAIILPGVGRIGERAVIGAGAVVTRPVPDGCTYVGAPGRLLSRDCAR